MKWIKNQYENIMKSILQSIKNKLWVSSPTTAIFECFASKHWSQEGIMNIIVNFTHFRKLLSRPFDNRFLEANHI